MTTAGRTGNGGTGRTVTTIQSGRANLGSMPNMTQSSSEMFLKISRTLSADKMIFFSCVLSLRFLSDHSAVSSSPVLRIFGWYLPHPLATCTKKKSHLKDITSIPLYLQHVSPFHLNLLPWGQSSSLRLLHLRMPSWHEPNRRCVEVYDETFLEISL